MLRYTIIHVNSSYTQYNATIHLTIIVNTIMASPKQKRLFEIIQANPTMPKYQAMMQAGYSKITSEKRTHLYDKAIEAAAEITARDYIAQRELSRKHIDKELKEELKEGKPQPLARDVFTRVGMSRESVVNELVKVMKQDKDFNNKLKALSPLLKILELSPDSETTTNAPTLNVTVKQNPASVEPPLHVDAGGEVSTKENQ